MIHKSSALSDWLTDSTQPSHQWTTVPMTTGLGSGVADASRTLLAKRRSVQTKRHFKAVLLFVSISLYNNIDLQLRSFIWDMPSVQSMPEQCCEHNREHRLSSDCTATGDGSACAHQCSPPITTGAIAIANRTQPESHLDNTPSLTQTPRAV